MFQQKTPEYNALLVEVNRIKDAGKILLKLDRQPHLPDSSTMLMEDFSFDDQVVIDNSGIRETTIKNSSILSVRDGTNNAVIYQYEETMVDLGYKVPTVSPSEATGWVTRCIQRNPEEQKQAKIRETFSQTLLERQQTTVTFDPQLLVRGRIPVTRHNIIAGEEKRFVIDLNSSVDNDFGEWLRQTHFNSLSSMQSQIRELEPDNPIRQEGERIINNYFNE